jgi:hypothetical protein
MNLSEFKYWFSGFTEDMKGVPSSEAWKKIKAKIDKIEEDPTPTTRDIFIEKYWYPRPYRRYWDSDFWYSTLGKSHDHNMKLCASSLKSQIDFASKNHDSHLVDQSTFDAGSAFKLLGRAEAKSMKA